MFLTKIIQQNFKKLQSDRLLDFVELAQIAKLVLDLKPKDFKKTVEALIDKLDEYGKDQKVSCRFLNVSLLLSVLDLRAPKGVFRDVVYEKLAASKSMLFAKNMSEAIGRSDEDIHSVLMDNENK